MGRGVWGGVGTIYFGTYFCDDPFLFRACTINEDVNGCMTNSLVNGFTQDRNFLRSCSFSCNLFLSLSFISIAIVFYFQDSCG